MAWVLEAHRGETSLRPVKSSAASALVCRHPQDFFLRLFFPCDETGGVCAQPKHTCTYIHSSQAHLQEVFLPQYVNKISFCTPYPPTLQPNYAQQLLVSFQRKLMHFKNNWSLPLCSSVWISPLLSPLQASYSGQLTSTPKPPCHCCWLLSSAAEMCSTFYSAR